MQFGVGGWPSVELCLRYSVTFPQPWEIKPCNADQKGLIRAPVVESFKIEFSRMVVVDAVNVSADATSIPRVVRFPSTADSAVRIQSQFFLNKISADASSNQITCFSFLLLLVLFRYQILSILRMTRKNSYYIGFYEISRLAKRK